MNHIDELIAELCPNGVEYRALGEIADVGTGSNDRKDAVDDGTYPFYVRSQTVMRIDTYQFDEEAIVIPGEGGIGDIFHFVSGKYSLHQRAYRIHFAHPGVNTRFAFHYLTGHFKRFIQSQAVNATVSSIRKPMITKFRIPIPPQAIQEAVVAVLDDLTRLEAELRDGLTSERDGRLCQYKYQCDALLSPDSQNRKSIDELTVSISSGRCTNRLTQGDYPVYGSTGEIARTDSPSHSGEALLVARVGANAGHVNLVDGDYDVTDNTLIVVAGLEWSPRFAYHQLKHANLNQFAMGGGQPLITGKKLKAITLSIPPIDEQRAIVELLDTLDALVTEITDALPAEINARRKQYEHYRDRLLTFPELQPSSGA